MATLHLMMTATMRSTRAAQRMRAAALAVLSVAIGCIAGALLGVLAWGEGRAPVLALVLPFAIVFSRSRLQAFAIGFGYGMTIRVDAPQQPTPPAVLPGQNAPPPPPPPPWAEAPVRATAAFDPVEAASLLACPGLRFQKLVFSFGRDGLPQYQFSGVQYVRPQ